MDVSCPNCGASYRIPEALLAGGKKLRCAACSHQFAPLAPAPVQAPEPEVEPPWRSISVDPPMAEAARPPAPVVPDPSPVHPVARRAEPKRPSPLALAWAASVAILALTLGGLMSYRMQIAEAWPPYGRVAMLLGG